MHSYLTEVRSLTPLQSTIGDKNAKLYNNIVQSLHRVLYRKDSLISFEALAPEVILTNTMGCGARRNEGRGRNAGSVPGVINRWRVVMGISWCCVLGEPSTVTRSTNAAASVLKGRVRALIRHDPNKEDTSAGSSFGDGMMCCLT